MLAYSDDGQCLIMRTCNPLGCWSIFLSEGVERRVTGNLDPQDIIISKMLR